MKDTAMLDLRARANAFDLSRLPSFHFSLPFSDSTPPPQTRDDAIDNIRDFAADSDNMSMTSLEYEALAPETKTENNRLRGILDGLPKIGIPNFHNPEEPFAGLSEETRDLNIVVMGGYRGSILRSAEDGRMLWIPVKVGLGIRKVDLELPLDEGAEAAAARTIYPDGMLTNIGPVDISRRLLKKLRDMQDRGFCKVSEFGYDWRLGGSILSDQLVAFLEPLGGNTLVIAHSLGGLVTLKTLNRRPDLFRRGILFAGTPFHGLPNILGPLRYGDGVLLNKSVLNAQTNFSMRSSFLLLPTHKRCFVDIDTGKELPVDFFDPESWLEYGLSPVVARDHGAGDVGEATDVNGMMATAGLGGPAIGNQTTTTTTSDEGDRKTHLSPASAGTDNGRLRSRSHSPAGPRDKTLPVHDDRDGNNLVTSTDDDDDDDDARRRASAYAYLERTLAATLAFKADLYPRPGMPYPSLALLRSSSTPTVRGCSVDGYRGIREGDYTRFIYSPGDGVVTFACSDLSTLHPSAELQQSESSTSPVTLTREDEWKNNDCGDGDGGRGPAVSPTKEGGGESGGESGGGGGGGKKRTVRWGDFIVRDVANDRGHIGLLGDLAGVESCLVALLRGKGHTSSSSS